MDPALAEIGKLAHAKGALFHTDAAQAAGKIWLDVQAMNIDLLSISGHKMYAPKGVGALYVRRRPRVRLEPLFDGGGQERGVRSGTLPAPLCVALGAAARIARESHAEEGNALGILRRRFLNAVARGVPDAAVNGSESHRFAGNINLRLPGVDAQRLLEQIPELSLSLGSACTSAAVEPSYVLRAIGLSDAEAAASLRVGLGRFTTEAEVDFAAERLTAAAGRLRAGDAVPSPPNERAFRLLTPVGACGRGVLPRAHRPVPRRTVGCRRSPSSRPMARLKGCPGRPPVLEIAHCNN
jgi:cysteine desulfurase